MKTPDIMVTENKSTVIVEPQTIRAVQWLRRCGGMEIETPHDKVRLDPKEWRQLGSSLASAGLTVWVDG